MKKAYLIIFITLSLGFIACSPQKKLQRLLKKYPELITKDTIIVKDTVITQTNSIDTVLLFNTLKEFDTIYLHREKLTVKLIRTHDTLLLGGECLGDTIYTEKKIIVDKIKYINEGWEKHLPYLYILMALLFIFGIFRTIFK